MDKSNTILITGATGAVGSVIASAFTDTGVNMVLTGRRQASLDRLADELKTAGMRTLLFAADISRAGNVQDLMAAIEERFGGADILVNIAGGWSGGGKLADTTEEEWDSALDMNLRSAFLINRAVLPYMIERGWGRIVNFASKAAESPVSKQAGYNVAKAGVVALTASIASEYRKSGIAANVLLPGIIDTPGNRKQMPDADFSRWVSVEDLSALVLMLCGKEGGSINGAKIPVYGRV
jgi:NAD(P)-dependent dehydrogenase (short-subunit alcohol dehydrogenase family)